MDKLGKTVNDVQNAVMMKMSNPASFSHEFYFLLSVCFSECWFCDKNKYRQYLQLLVIIAKTSPYKGPSYCHVYCYALSC